MIAIYNFSEAIGIRLKSRTWTKITTKPDAFYTLFSRNNIFLNVQLQSPRFFSHPKSQHMPDTCIKSVFLYTVCIDIAHHFQPIRVLITSPYLYQQFLIVIALTRQFCWNQAETPEYMISLIYSSKYLPFNHMVSILIAISLFVFSEVI